jgi:outer membrane protein assembly factor BamB
VRRLRLAWKRKTAGTYGSPVVGGGRVYVADLAGNLSAFRARTGTLLWRRKPGRSGVGGSTPAFAAGRIYVGGQKDGRVYALNARTGKVIWAFKTGAASDAPSPVSVANGIVYVAGGGSWLYALRSRNGARVWARRIWNEGFASAVARDVVYALGSPLVEERVASQVLALSAKRGRLLWSSDLFGEARMAAAVAGKLVYVASSVGELNALRVGGCGRRFCTPVWRAKTGRNPMPPSLAYGRVFVTSERLEAFDATTGRHLWSATAEPLARSAAVVANGVVYVGSEWGSLYAFRASGCGGSSCRPLWSAKVDDDWVNSPAVAGGTLYAITFGGDLFAFKVK